MQKIDAYNLSREAWEHIIDQWIIGQNSERDRKILKRRLLDGVTFDRLADEFMLSRPQIERIVYKGQTKVFAHTK